MSVSKLIPLVCHNGATPHLVFDPMNLCEAPNLEAKKLLVPITLSTEHHQVSLSNLMFFQIMNLALLKPSESLPELLLLLLKQLF